MLFVQSIAKLIPVLDVFCVFNAAFRLKTNAATQSFCHLLGVTAVITADGDVTCIPSIELWQSVCKCTGNRIIYLLYLMAYFWTLSDWIYEYLLFLLLLFVGVKYEPTWRMKSVRLLWSISAFFFFVVSCKGGYQKNKNCLSVYFICLVPNLNN